MAAEVDGYEILASLPAKHPTTGPTTERERLAAKQRRHEQEAIIKAAEEQIKTTHRELAKIRRDTLLNPKVQDQDLFCSEGFQNCEISSSDARLFNGFQAKEFVERHPEFIVTTRNLSYLGDYFDRNGVGVTTTEMIENLYQRMVDAGVPFDQRPPELEAPEIEAPSGYPQPSVSPQIARASAPETLQGFDLNSGSPRTFTSREIDRMSGDEYRRVFRIFKANLDLPSIGPGPKGWQQA